MMERQGGGAKRPREGGGKEEPDAAAEKRARPAAAEQLALQPAAAEKRLARAAAPPAAEAERRPPPRPSAPSAEQHAQQALALQAALFAQETRRLVRRARWPTLSRSRPPSLAWRSRR